MAQQQKVTIKSMHSSVQAATTLLAALLMHLLSKNSSKTALIVLKAVFLTWALKTVILVNQMKY